MTGTPAPQWVTLSLHRGPMLTGRVSCGRSVSPPYRVVSVILTDRRDPRWTPENAGDYVRDIAPWAGPYPPDYLHAEALLHAAACGFYCDNPTPISEG